ncbi:intracellular serine protease [Niveomyces insectorum RCEF 264]|uniref:Intracellular serine protease n=1 Tax=Niveomyces insectorum RCEF 264 TaxID=1081102 RepID=A0A167QSH9_9HYPO|nr:intracellular serine protease [Niveomyces insectorum RCEF 264]
MATVETLEEIYPDSDDGRIEAEDVDESEKRHLEILAEAKFLKPGDVAQFQGLVKRNLEDVMRRKTNENRTFLHVVAGDANPTLHVRWLVAAVLAYPAGVKQMGQEDVDKKTPLYTAITKYNKHFLAAAVGRPSSDTTIKRVGEALAIETARPGEATSLHAAVTNQRKISTDVLLRIIKVVPEKTIGIQDASGHTPLHLAVEYSRCATPQQLSVVQALIARDPSVLAKTTRDGYSVYQYHVKTRPLVPSLKAEHSVLQHLAKPPPSTAERGGPGGGRAAQPAGEKPSMRIGMPSIIGFEEDVPRATTTRRHDDGKSAPKHSQADGKPSLAMVTQVDRPPSVPAPRTPVEQQRSAATSGKQVVRRFSAKTVEAYADQIKEELKLQSLRVMPCDVALRCLQTDSENDKELWFDYVPSPQATMTFKDFKTHWSKLDFDSTLQYVALPSIHFKLGEDEEQPAERTRDDALRIFKWLAERGVRRVLRVIVLDAAAPDNKLGYHSNEVIASALRGLRVEMLDWSRPDMCPSTIFQIGDNLRELCLQWSGNSAILRAWSELQGLPMLAKFGQLELIRIAVPKDNPDIGPYTRKNLEKFVERFKNNWTTMAELFNKVWEKATSKKPATNKNDLTDQEKAASSGLSAEELADQALKKAQAAAKQKLLERLLAGLTEGAVSAEQEADKTAEKSIEKNDQGMNGSASNTAIGQQQQQQQQQPSQPQTPADYPSLPKPPRIRIEDAFGGHRFTSYEADDGAGSASKPNSDLEQHRWIRCMEDFASAMLRVPRPDAEEIQDNPMLAPIKVALIDDGVDTTNPSLQGRKYQGKSFDFYENGRRNHAYWISTSGHGTIMARFIRTVCPTAEIYVIKLSADLVARDTNKLTVDVESAISSIQHAVDRNARIISMSWSVKEPDNNEQRNRFKDALQNAIRAGIIMYCAASDQGNMGDKTYPYGGANSDDIFRIGAATPLGTAADYTGDAKLLQFTFPGHDVVLKDDTPDKHLGDVQRGSSVATALAAGLAAMVLECARLGHLRTVRTPREDRERMAFPITADDVREMNAVAMRNAFLKMGTSGTSYIWVWESFTAKINETIKDGTPEEQLETIAGLAWKFLGK